MVLNKYFSIVVISLFLSGCSGNTDEVVPPTPQEITQDSVGHFCGMDLIEHDGPKGQIFVKGNDKPLWFSTIRQVMAYSILPDSPKGLSAIYVTDMSKVENLHQPETGSWMKAVDAYYVTESSFQGGMGGEDPLPFSNEAQALAFIQEHGGRIQRFGEMSEDYILHYDVFAANDQPGNTLPEGNKP